MKKVFLNLIILAISTCTAFGRHHHHRHRNQHVQSYLNIDAFGNCHDDNRQLSGRCIRFQNCPSAVSAWQQQQIQPLSCYYTTYENFVCCPYQSHYTNEFWTPIPYSPQPQTPPVLPTLSSHLPLQSPPPISEEFLNRAGQTRNFSQSDSECVNTYFAQSHKRRRHRGRRNLDENDSEDNVAVEETIDRESQSQTEAVGGMPTERDEFPYMCAIGWKSTISRGKVNYNCGCVLIAQRYVLTAAHCALLGGESPTVVRLGGVDLDEVHAEILKIKRITQHPEYVDDSAYNDIAIVKLEKRSRKTPACLWNIESLPEQRLTAIGYGQTQFAGPSSNSLLKVFLDIISNEECSAFYKPRDKLSNGLGAGHICAGDPKNKMDTCQGDSGGPLILKVAKQNMLVPYIVGLTSFGEGCASGTPSVYTRISAYIDWIENVVWK